MKRKWKKGVALLLLVALLLAVAPAQAQENTPKEEVVYANLHSDGSVDGVYVVNSFVLSEDGQIVDYGDYTALRNLTSSEEIAFDDQRVTIDAQQGRLYYEGVLREDSLPWLFTIQYWLDGRAMAAEELAGKSGHLQIDIQIAQNPACPAVFFENYALQVTLQLDTALCRNIRAEGATVANVGRKKQITYTILPGQEQRLSLAADVTDFAMEQISLNGVTLSMAIELNGDQYPALQNGLRQIESAAVQFDEGALQLFTGMEQLRGGAVDLRSNLQQLQQGTNELSAGSGDVRQGAAAVQDGAQALHVGSQEALDGAAQLQAGAADLRDGASDLSTGIAKACRGASALDDGLAEALDGAVQLRDGAETLEEKINGVQEEAQRLEQAFDQLQQNQELQEKLQQLLGKLEGKIPTGSQLEFEQAIKQVEAYGAQLEQTVEDLQRLCQGIYELYDGLVVLRQGSAELLDGLEQLQTGAAQLEQGAIVLQDGTASLYEGIVALEDGSYGLLSGAVDLSAGTVTLADGMVQLQDGTAALCGGAIELEQGVLRLEDGLLELQGGTMRFRDQTADLDGSVLAQLRQGIDQLFGNGEDVGSFVSPQNTNVQSVQFVIRTPAIELEEPAQETAQAPQKLTFWQKLLRLFGLDW